MKSKWNIFIALGFAGAAAAQNPAVNTNGVVNVASFAYTGLPNGDIAPGSMVVIFGSNMGPATLQQAGAYPLPITLGGTSVKVTSGSTTTDAIINYTSAGQIAAIIPSATPAGAATLTVTYNGKASAPAPFKIVANSFGVFAANQGGSGPGNRSGETGAIPTLPPRVPLSLNSELAGTVTETPARAALLAITEAGKVIRVSFVALTACRVSLIISGR